MFLSVSPIERLAATEVCDEEDPDGGDNDDDPDDSAAEFAEAMVAEGFTMKDFTVLKMMSARRNHTGSEVISSDISEVVIKIGIVMVETSY